MNQPIPLPPRASEPDPIRGVLAIVAVFAVLVFWRLGTPSKIMFDEVHYLPAARHLIALSSRLNPEHPLLGKELIALGMMLFGDNPFGWRFCNALYGVIGLYGAIRAFWWASLSGRGTLLFGVFLATNFIWFVLSRIAILDMAMAASLALAFWQWALAARKGARVHLVLAGLFMGLSMGGKWNGVPLMVFPGLWYAHARWRASAGQASAGQASAGRPHRALAWLVGRAGGPVPGVCLIEAALWLGIWPVLVYFATFTPAMFYAVNPLSPWHLVEWQQTMLKLQDSVVKPHRYMSHWYQWMLNARPIWFFYEKWDGAQRGVLMIGNPYTMWAGLPALLWCAADGAMALARRSLALPGKWWPTGRDRLSALSGMAALFYVGSLFFWAINGKPVQFYYHYQLAAVFLDAALALVLAQLWRRGLRWPAWTSLALALLGFVYFFPILAASPLPSVKSFRLFTWMPVWK
ncbi:MULTISPECIES: glycosyltransferase family 39 protein [unclassified Novosphingobium]|uniref:glycosyltransferase family 39 protein n=1 Tax=unclassified Novosphingobium TaxID=2644732 RepID=UPI00146EEEEF|nr:MULTISPECIES: glycosyltransferase family 39 protein [unclassified Novosphingobium]NMN03272.1 dolichyl-phosphate-mannose--protein O-mannosyl transferase [Novosphingobium sp. SG919]NMN86738.1 dolichyl-phosphate-mannose--protein O-mannosyl transferase [Novosphingobium sp. SG916]